MVAFPSRAQCKDCVTTGQPTCQKRRAKGRPGQRRESTPRARYTPGGNGRLARLSSFHSPPGRRPDRRMSLPSGRGPDRISAVLHDPNSKPSHTATSRRPPHIQYYTDITSFSPYIKRFIGCNTQWHNNLLLLFNCPCSSLPPPSSRIPPLMPTPTRSS